jgi:signal transduction histidine kinase
MLAVPRLGRLPRRRPKLAWGLAVLGPQVIAVGSRALGASVPPATILCSTLLVVVGVALIGGVVPALTTVVVGLIAQEVIFSFPYGSLGDHEPAQLAVLAAFVAIGAVVGLLVDELTQLIEEQAALRRITMLVATEAPTDEVFTKVTEAVGQLLPVDFATVGRYDSDGTLRIVGDWTIEGLVLSFGAQQALPGQHDTMVTAPSQGPLEVDDGSGASGPGAGIDRRRSARSSLGTPITVEGQLWGVMIAGPHGNRRMPRDAESRLTAFTDLLATAISNAESRGKLAASRARIVAAADETRRRIERDLHDGAQQRLVALGLELRTAQAAVPPEIGELKAALSRVAEGLTAVQDELLEIARGIHPAILARGGLGPALKTLARRSPIPVELDIRMSGRPPDRVEVATYYVVSEALTNAAKHAHASLVRVEVETVDRALQVRVHDDGGGGADPSRGSGLVGLKDRVEALGGAFTVQSSIGAGTSVQMELPLEKLSR